MVGFETGDDAAVYKLNEQQALIFTVDFFPPVVDDPFSFGAVAAANSFSDVYAMGGTPICALNIVGFPVDLPKEILSEIMRGGYTKAQEAGCLIAGGHTVDDKEPKYGLAVVGLVEPDHQVTNAGAKAGDVLVLTKPLGTGIITTAGKQGVVEPLVLEEAVRVMSTLNAEASRAMMKVGVNSATDVTGFGLVGHLRGMMAASGTTARVEFSRVPVIGGVWELLGGGRGARRNPSKPGRRRKPGCVAFRDHSQSEATALRRADLRRAADIRAGSSEGTTCCGSWKLRELKVRWLSGRFDRPAAIP